MFPKLEGELTRKHSIKPFPRPDAPLSTVHNIRGIPQSHISWMVGCGHMIGYFLTTANGPELGLVIMEVRFVNLLMLTGVSR